MNKVPLSLGNIFGEMPPARNKPPADIIFSARFEASAPYTAIQTSKAFVARGSFPPSAAPEIAAAGSPDFIAAESSADSFPRPLEHKNS